MTGDILNRVELRTAEQARAVLAQLTLPWVGEQLKAGRELVAEFRLLDDDITERQRAYLHAVVLTEIAIDVVVAHFNAGLAIVDEVGHGAGGDHGQTQCGGQRKQ